jgi:hypothetical protein
VRSVLFELSMKYFTLLVVLFSSCYINSGDDDTCVNGVLDAGETSIDCSPNCEACVAYVIMNSSNDTVQVSTNNVTWATSGSFDLGNFDQDGFNEYNSFNSTNNYIRIQPYLFLFPIYSIHFNQSLDSITKIEQFSSSFEHRIWIAFNEAVSDCSNVINNSSINPCDTEYGNFLSSSQVVITQNDGYVGGYVSGYFNATLASIPQNQGTCLECYNPQPFSGSFKLMIQD